jgi:hypothetical protein
MAAMGKKICILMTELETVIEGNNEETWSSIGL